MDKGGNMNINLGNLAHTIAMMFESNVRLREQNAVLSCGLVIVTIAWLRERHKRLQKENKDNKEGE